MLLQHGSRCIGISCRQVWRRVIPSLSSSRHWCSTPSTSCRVAGTAGPDQLSDIATYSSPEASSSSSSSSSSWEDEQEQEFPEVQLLLPPPTHTQVKSAEFIKSSVDVKQCPPAKYPEFAVIGRSNAGKSSLINLLTNRKSLAMVSKQPGKTRCINHFLVNDSWYLVDLPGYGYARTGKDARREFEQFTRQYFKQRNTLAMVLLLVDCSIPPQDVDLQYAAQLGQLGVPFSIVFTKADKRKKGVPKHTLNVAAFKQALLETQGFALVPPSIVTSSSTGAGKQELLNFVASLRVMFEQQHKQSKRPKKSDEDEDD